MGGRDDSVYSYYVSLLTPCANPESLEAMDNENDDKEDEKCDEVRKPCFFSSFHLGAGNTS